MHRDRLTFTVLLLSAVALHAQEAPPPPESVAKPSQLSMSCTIDAFARTAHVLIVNRTDERLGFQMVVGRGFNYKIEVTSKGGVRLPQRDYAPQSQGQALSVSVTQVNLAPKAQYTEELQLSEVVDLPRDGGTFRIRLGRVLASHTVLEPDPKEIVWCKPMEITFPPLK